jgi:hypothetical protein
MFAAGVGRTLRPFPMNSAAQTMPIAIAVLSIVLILGFVLIKRRKRPSTMSRTGVTLDVRRFK